MRRYFRFRLRTLLLIIVVTCVVMGWVARSRRQQKIVEWVLAQGGTVKYSHEVDASGVRLDDPRPPGIAWLRERLGIDYLDSVVVVHLMSATDDLTPLSKLRSLHTLNLFAAPVTDLTPLNKLKRLRKLNLFRTQVSDLTPIVEQQNLRTLYISGPYITDITPLAKLTELRQLQLYDTEISDLTPLAGLSKLETLGINNSPVSDVSPLSGLHNLRTLKLYGTRVSDLRSLAGLNRITISTRGALNVTVPKDLEGRVDCYRLASRTRRGRK